VEPSPAIQSLPSDLGEQVAVIQVYPSCVPLLPQLPPLLLLAHPAYEGIHISRESALP
jgi:hypothetical protein